MAAMLTRIPFRAAFQANNSVYSGQKASFSSAWNKIRFSGNGKGKKIAIGVAGALAAGGVGLATALTAAVYADVELHPPKYPWPHSGVLGQDELPAPAESSVRDVTCYPWAIDTKYYTAHAQLCVTSAPTIGDRDFASRVQAVLLYFDRTSSSFDLVKSWIPFVKEIDPEVKLLITDRCTDIGRNEYMEWCIEYGFELVETDPDVDDDDDFAEPRGYKRVISALYAHTWPNLELKNSSTNFRSPYMRTLMQEAEGACANAEETCDEKGAKEENECESKDKSAKEGGDMLELFAALGNEDPGDESFESLFERMKLMKEKAEKLPEGERKAYAERIAMQFMRAMGCEDDVLLSTSDEEDK